MGLRSIRHGTAPISLAVLLTFGCATVRVPASQMEGDVAVGEDRAEPQVELWLESGTPVSEAEKARATAQVRAALLRASETLLSEDGESLLVVRAQGIARTASRRSNQRAAKVGIAVGAVAVAVVIVAALVASGGKGSGGKGSGAPKLGGGRIAPRHVPAVGRAVPRFRLHPVGVSVGHPHRATGPVAVDLDVVVPVQGAPSEPMVSVAAQPPEEAAPAGEPAAPPITLHLPPPRPLDVEKRKFFDKDLTRLELIAVDRASGEPTWVKTVEGQVDPRDAEAVRRLLAAAVEDRTGWTAAPLARAE